jgi:hypothetical protein
MLAGLVLPRCEVAGTVLCTSHASGDLHEPCINVHGIQSADLSRRRNRPVSSTINIEAGPADGVRGTILIHKGFLRQYAMTHDGHGQVEGAFGSMKSPHNTKASNNRENGIGETIWDQG